MIQLTDVEELLQAHNERTAQLRREVKVGALLRDREPTCLTWNVRLGERLSFVVRLLSLPKNWFTREPRVNGN